MKQVPKSVLYLCNGKAECGKPKSTGCFLGGPLSLKTCKYTTDPTYAKYEPTEHPELDFDRFKIERIDDKRTGRCRRELYIEKEDYYGERKAAY